MKAGAWYLVAAAGAKVRTYRVDSIRALSVLEVAAGRPARFDLARYWAEAARSFEDRLIGTSIRVRLSATGVRLLRDFHPRAWEALQRRRPTVDAAGWVRAAIPFEQGEHGVREALRLGAEMEVLAPASLRRAISAEALRIARRARANATGRERTRVGRTASRRS
jgi:predicted DNA-binding transcriptional regulator YafY